MQCSYYQAARCRSCTELETPYLNQLAHKQQTLATLLQDFSVATWHPAFSSPEIAFRNKAKMVVLGVAHAPILGIISPDGTATSLTDCPLYPPDMQALLRRLERWIQQAGIPPYRVDKAKGELKFILLTRSHAYGEYLLRFVLRSEQALERIRYALPMLCADYPQIRVISANIQPIHAAVLEGKQEIFLSTETALAEMLNDVPLFIRPQSFFQTNPQVASALYQTARQWCRALQPKRIWDLFCGVGGFGLHCASSEIALTGIEIAPEAIASARQSAELLGFKQVDFRALPSEAVASIADALPDVVIVNPPRRGLGRELAQYLQRLAPPTILYSSCNAETLVQDLRVLLPKYQIRQVQLFDMFPHTAHYEVLVELGLPTSVT